MGKTRTRKEKDVTTENTEDTEDTEDTENTGDEKDKGTTVKRGP